MKLKNKLYISFCIMVILPVLLSGLALGGLYCVQKDSIERTYNVDEGANLVGVNSPIILFGKITNLGGIIKRVDSERELQKFRLKIG